MHTFTLSMDIVISRTGKKLEKLTLHTCRDISITIQSNRSLRSSVTCYAVTLKNDEAPWSKPLTTVKDGEFVELGERPLSKKEKGDKGGEAYKQKWKKLLALAESGELDKIKEIAPAEYVLHFPKFKSLRDYQSTIIDGALGHEWWYGPTGTGKSRTVWELFPNHYQKELNKWWCGYNGEDVVVIEEWCPKNECTGSHLKIWADRYPFTAQIKGGSLQKIRPKKIIVLSNYTIDQCFTNVEDLLPLKRRFTIKHFSEFSVA